MNVIENGEAERKHMACAWRKIYWFACDSWKVCWNKLRVQRGPRVCDCTFVHAQFVPACLVLSLIVKLWLFMQVRNTNNRCRVC